MKPLFKFKRRYGTVTEYESTLPKGPLAIGVRLLLIADGLPMLKFFMVQNGEEVECQGDLLLSREQAATFLEAEVSQ